ncbi:MAG: HNH endonuclease [Polynucleobacter sp.]
MALKEYRATSHWKKLRLQVLRRDAYTCTYCGDVANEVDHVYPKSKGGEDTLDNCVAACRTCNIKKKDSVDVSHDGVFLARGSTPPAFSFDISPSRTNRTNTDKSAQTLVKIDKDSPFSAPNEPGART